MHKITAENMKNLLEAQVFWKSVDPLAVDLRDYRIDGEDKDPPHCGSAACFGGWLPYSEYFQSIGVTAQDDSSIWGGAPTLLDNYTPPSVSLKLFGWWMFGSARTGFSPLDSGGNNIRKFLDLNGSDYEIVAHRIKCAIEHSEVV